MAKIKKSVSFKDAIIDADAGTITEITKDGEFTYNLADVLKDWDGVGGISLIIQQADDILPDSPDNACNSE